MDDFRRFLRYLLPGVVFLLELSIFVLLTQPRTADNMLSWVGSEKVGSDPRVQVIVSLFAAVALLLTSGALGYVFSVIHHTLWGRVPFYGGTKDTYRRMLQRAERANLLRLYSLPVEEGEPRTIDCSMLTREGVWRAESTIWYMSCGKSKAMGAAEVRASSVYDLMHGAGACFVASLAAYILWGILLWHDQITPVSTSWQCSLLILFGLVLLVHLANFRRLERHAGGLTENMLCTHLRALLAHERPLACHVSESDLMPSRERPRWWRRIIDKLEWKRINGFYCLCALVAFALYLVWPKVKDKWRFPCWPALLFLSLYLAARGLFLFGSTLAQWTARLGRRPHPPSSE